MPVGPAARNETEEIGERRKTFDIFGSVTWMSHFDSIESKLRKWLGSFPAPLGTRMSPDCESAC
jgi:hypothetical protein